jgi:methyl-accepting chemotaxis protein
MARFLRRRKYLVNRKLQYNLLLTSLLYVILFAVALAATLFVPLIIRLRNLDPASAEASQTALEFLYLHSKFWPTVILTFGIIALHSIYTSHRFAGPLYRFTVIFNRIKQGFLPRSVNLRKGDFLQAEMSQINEMIGSLRTKIEDIRRAQSELREAVHLCRQEFGRELTDDERELLNDLIRKGDLLEAKVAQFHIEA